MGFCRAKVHHGYSLFLLIHSCDVGIVWNDLFRIPISHRFDHDIDVRCGAFFPAEMITDSYVPLAHRSQCWREFAPYLGRTKQRWL